MPEKETIAPKWMRPPSWRWTAAMKLASQCNAPPTWKDLPQKGFPKDKYLLKAARYYHTSYNPQYGGAQAARVRQPNMYRAGLIFKGMDFFYQWKIYLESMFLTKLSIKEIAEKLGIGQDVELLKTYRAVFFDMDPKRDSEAVIQANAMALSCQGSDMIPTEEYLSKLIAFSRGHDDFYRLFVAGDKDFLTDEDADWFQNIIRGKIAKKAASIAASKRPEYITENIEMLKTGREWLLTEDVDPDALGRKAKSEALSSLLSTVHKTCDESQAVKQLTEPYTNYMDVDWGEDAVDNTEENQDDLESK